MGEASACPAAARLERARPRREPLRRVGRADQPDRGSRWSARGQACGDQEQRAGRGPADGRRVEAARGLYCGRRRHRRPADSRRRRHDRRNLGVRGPLRVRRKPYRGIRPSPQSLEPRTQQRRLELRQCGPGRYRRGGHGDRRRPGGLHPRPRRVVGPRRPQADPRARALHRGLPNRTDPRPPRTHGDDRRRRRSAPVGDRGSRRARPAPDTRSRRGTTTPRESGTASPDGGSEFSATDSGSR